MKYKSYEDNEQILFVKYIKRTYPNIIFNFDMGGVHLPIGYAIKMKRMGNRKGYPDFFFAEPKGEYHGLFIELKNANVKLKKRNGDWSSPHIQEQAEMLIGLRMRGYKAEFAIGFDEAKVILDDYLFMV